MISTSGHFVPVMFGEGAAQQIGAKAKAMGMTKALIVCDAGVKNAGVIDPIAENLRQAGIAVCVFDGVLPDPPEQMVNEAIAMADKEKVDGFIGVGGGSSIDTAKVTNFCHKYGGPISNWYGKAAIQPDYPLIVVPTTAGTGSEMTYGAVITTESHVKSGLGGPAIFADLAIVDPLLYVGLPLRPTLACAFDVYTHAVEAIIHPRPNPLTDACAEKAVRLVHKALPRLVKDTKDLEARADMAAAATLAGAAINSTLCHNSHAIGHSLGAVFHLPHGLCCAVGFPTLMKMYGEKYPERTRLAAEAMGLDLPANLSPAEIGKRVSAHVRDFIKASGLQNLKEAGVPKDRLDEAIKLMTSDMVQRSVPEYCLTEEEYRDIVYDAYDA